MECYASKGKTALLTLASVAMTAASIFAIGHNEFLIRIVGWVGVVFFGLGLCVALRDILRRGPVVVINEEGIEDRRLWSGAIPWDEIEDVTVEQVKGSGSSSRFLAVHVEDPDRYLIQAPFYRRWLMRLNPALGFPKLCIGFVNLSPGLDDAMACIRRLLPKADDDTPPTEGETAC